MHKFSRIFWGVGFISLALFLVLSQCGLITAEFSVWSVVVALLSVAMFLSGLAKRSFGAMFFAVGMAYVAFGEMIGLPYIGVWTMLTIVVLLTIGFNFIFPKNFRGVSKDRWTDYEDGDKACEYQKATIVDEEGYVRCSNSFGALVRCVETSYFKGGRFTNSFGELKVHLDRAHITSGPVTVNVSNSFGSLVIYVSKEWNVVCNISTFLGDVQEQNRAVNANGPMLKLIGNVSFGDIIIVYV